MRIQLATTALNNSIYEPIPQINQRARNIMKLLRKYEITMIEILHKFCIF